MKSNLKCIHKNCISNNEAAVHQRELFCIPKNEYLSRQWLLRLNRYDLMNLKYTELLNRGYRVCQLHFTDNQFQTVEKKKLNAGQVPLWILPTDAEIETLEAMKIQNVAEENRHPETNGNMTLCCQEIICGPSARRAVSPKITTDSVLSSTPHRREVSPELITLCRLEPSRKSKLTLKKRKLYARLQKTEKMLSLNRKRGRFLQQKYRHAVVDIKSSSSFDNIANIYSLPRPLRIFVLCRLRYFHKTKKVCRYTVEEKSLFLSIMKHSPQCYRFLEKLLCLPSVRTLSRCLTNFNLETGINDTLFRHLKSVSESLSPKDRFCSLLFDEMELYRHMSLSVSKNSWRENGFMDMGLETSGEIVDNVLVFMIRGIGKKWKQPVAFYFTHSAANQNTLKTLIKEVVRAVHERTDFKIVASVCNGDSWHVAALRSLAEESKREADEFVYNIDGHKIIHLFDAPHLLKCMRNNFITKDIVYQGKVAKWIDIQKLHDLDAVEISTSFKSTKLTNAHMNPTSRQKRKVKLAAQVFSWSTASFLQILTNVKAMQAQGSANFIKFMNNLFDSLNSVSHSAKPLASCLTDESPHMLFWRTAVKSLKNIRFMVGDKEVKKPPCVKLLIATIRNVQYLWKTLQNVGFECLTLRSLNLDPVENLFSIISELCGGNTRPTTSEFVNLYKTAILNNIVKCGVGSNCEDDCEKLLLSYNILLKAYSQETSNPLPLISSAKPS